MSSVNTLAASAKNGAWSARAGFNLTANGLRCRRPVDGFELKYKTAVGDITAISWEDGDVNVR